MSKIGPGKTFSFSNPTGGTINKSDMELCDNIAHNDIMALFAEILEQQHFWMILSMFNGCKMDLIQPQVHQLTYFDSKHITKCFIILFLSMFIFQD